MITKKFESLKLLCIGVYLNILLNPLNFWYTSLSQWLGLWTSMQFLHVSCVHSESGWDFEIWTMIPVLLALILVLTKCCCPSLSYITQMHVLLAPPSVNIILSCIVSFCGMILAADRCPLPKMPKRWPSKPNSRDKRNLTCKTLIMIGAQNSR